MINYMESIGVKFGANLNALHRSEMTCYNMSTLPVTRRGVIDSPCSFSSLRRTTSRSTATRLTTSAVSSSRSRTRQNASWRTNENSGPIFTAIRATRPATSSAVKRGLRSFDHKELRDFYHRWYRTDMQALFIVGDFDVDMMEQKVIALMSDIPAREPGTQADNRDCPERRTHRGHHHRPGTHRDQRDALYQEGNR